jgi:hypothetical protein
MIKVCEYVCVPGDRVTVEAIEVVGERGPRAQRFGNVRHQHRVLLRRQLRQVIVTQLEILHECNYERL